MSKRRGVHTGTNDAAVPENSRPESEGVRKDPIAPPQDTQKTSTSVFPALGAAVPFLTGVLYISGRARYSGYLEGLGLPSGLFPASSEEILYLGMRAESQLPMFATVALYSVALAILASAAVFVLLIVRNKIRASIERRRSGRKSTPSAGGKRDDGQEKWHQVSGQDRVLLGRFDTVLTNAYWSSIVIFFTVIVMAVGVELISVEQRDRGFRLAKAALEEFQAPSHSTGESGNPPIVSRVTYLRGGQADTFEGRLIMCSSEWCAYMLRDGKNFVLSTKLIVSSQDFGPSFSTMRSLGEKLTDIPNQQ